MRAGHEFVVAHHPQESAPNLCGKRGKLHERPYSHVAEGWCDDHAWPPQRLDNGQARPDCRTTVPAHRLFGLAHDRAHSGAPHALLDSMIAFYKAKKQ